jgi:hypothetical protein
MYQFNLTSNFVTITGLETGKEYMLRVGAALGSIPYSPSGVEWTQFTRLKVKSLNQEDTISISGASGVVLHDCTDSSLFVHDSISGDFIANFSGLQIAENHQQNIKVILQQDLNPYMITGVQITGSPQTLNWKDNTVPTGTISGVDVISLSVIKQTGSNYLIFSN